MKYKDFLKIAERLGEGARVETEIEETVIKDARLHKEDDYWYICQNKYDGSSCEDKLDYKYSYVVKHEGDAGDISYLKPLKKTLYNLEKGDVVEDRYGQYKIMVVVNGCYLLSESDEFDNCGNWYSPQELQKYDYRLVNQPPTSEIIEILGKTYRKDDVEERLAELEEVEN